MFTVPHRHYLKLLRLEFAMVAELKMLEISRRVANDDCSDFSPLALNGPGEPFGCENKPIARILDAANYRQFGFV
jgi:hypothetical protein